MVLPPSAHPAYAPAASDTRQTGTAPSFSDTSGGSFVAMSGTAATYTLSREVKRTHRASGEGTRSSRGGSRRWRRLSVPSRRTETRSFFGSSVGFFRSIGSRKYRRVPSGFQKAWGWKRIAFASLTAVTTWRSPPLASIHPSSK